ncbi:MAG: Uncharacterized protein CEN91_501 [Candidatus Berkelbacteria bacterium Licking1014_85]|uniref:50S ribosomal protein L28 n=1 Tax=Candidatus Berkelbacteria bacterium Licking1014_85 TaxID=2017148 RepID=A0A554LHF0_9BACT|nr:MAG: Uncharacterized protein CEN91_501 [Candidatus Berkelbacteria bacterium Licking1014_85]
MIKKYQQLKLCEVCGKKTSVGNNDPHSRQRTKRLFHPHLVTITGSARGLKVGICAKCNKTQIHKLHK